MAESVRADGSAVPVIRGESSAARRREHESAVRAMSAAVRSAPPGEPVRLAKKSSNLFRARRSASGPRLDVAGMSGVIDIDLENLTADVGGMCTYEDFVAATLPHGVSPLVVPQLKTITVGGAVTGLGIESTTYRNGLPHEGVVELDILTGTGDVVTAAPDGPHADLFRGFPNSFGSLGYATRLRMRLERVRPYVALRHLRFDDIRQLQDTLDGMVTSGTYDGLQIDYLDGVVFAAHESYLTVGTLTDEPGPVSDYTGQQIYYRSIQRRRSDRLTISDYLWRWDTDWFWCSRAFGAQQPLVRRLWPKRLRRSSSYWKLVALDNKLGLSNRVQRLRGEPPWERVVQDVEVPIERLQDFLDWFLETIPIEPIWLCPLHLTEGSPGDGPLWPLYPLRPGRTYVNVGFWSVVPMAPGAAPGATNRLIEDKVGEIGGLKSLYSDVYYSREEFGRRYGGEVYRTLKDRYDPEDRLLDLYAKVVQRR
jgi:FAD/FMN-containing dehydrogenase